MTKTKQLSTRPSEKTRAQIDDLVAQTGDHITSTIAQAIDRMWRAEFKMGFNRACKEMMITYDRQAFARYWQKVRKSKYERHTFEMWETIYRGFEQSRDYQDWLTTQQDALS